MFFISTYCTISSAASAARENFFFGLVLSSVGDILLVRYCFGTHLFKLNATVLSFAILIKSKVTKSRSKASTN